MTLFPGRSASGDPTPFWSDAELTQFADLIVRGRVLETRSEIDLAVDAVYTSVALEVSQVVKGDVGPGRLILKQLGGTVGGLTLNVAAQAAFVAGEDVLVFLERRPRDLALYTSGLWQGKWVVSTEPASGLRLAVRNRVGSSAQGVLGPARDVRRLDRFIEDLKTAARGPVRRVGLAESASAAAAAENRALPMTRRDTDLAVPVVRFRFASLASDRPSRWSASVARAASAWNLVQQHVRIVDDGAASTRCAMSLGRSGVVTVGTAEACGELALGGSIFAVTGRYRVGGEPEGTLVDAFVLGNETNLESLPSACVDEIAVHSVGHAIGLRDQGNAGDAMAPQLSPSCGRAAPILSEFAPRLVSNEDLKQLRALTAASAEPASSAPEDLAAASSGTSVILTWRHAVVEAADATDYIIEAGSAPGLADLANVSSGTAATALTTRDVAAGTYFIRVRAVDAAGGSAASNEATVTVGAGGAVGPASNETIVTIAPPRSVAEGGVLSAPAPAGTSAQAIQAGSLLGALSSAPLVQSGNLIYQGAFRVPSGTIGNDRSTFAFGGTALAFHPKNNSLFIIGHDWYQETAEISIPEVRAAGDVNGLAKAGMLQPFADITEGGLSKVHPGDPNGIKIGGLLPYKDKLYASAYAYYDATESQVLSHFVSGLDLSARGDVSGPFRMGAPKAGYVSGYFGLVPAAWQGALGGPVLNGNCCLSIIGRTSYGPALFAIDPTDIGTKNPVPAAPLVYYPGEHPLSAWNSTGPYFNGSTQMRGVVFPEGTRSVLLFGRHGLGKFCYGTGQVCRDPVDEENGTHAYPYSYYVWAYDAVELAAVRSGTRQPWDVKPYAVWELELPYHEKGSAIMRGAAYDPATGRIFISQAAGGGPIIHVFTIGSPPPAGQAPKGASLDFPPRSDSLDFRLQLEATYRDVLGRGPSPTYVDAEGSVVWTQEYLRYRVNLCSHEEAVARVMTQVDGEAGPPVCGTPSGSDIQFPPRDQSLAFRLALDAKYRDDLHRAVQDSYVDREGDAVWTQEYLRFRVNGCGHADAVQRVFTEVAGGAPPACGVSQPLRVADAAGR